LALPGKNSILLWLKEGLILRGNYWAFLSINWEKGLGILGLKGQEFFLQLGIKRFKLWVKLIIRVNS